MTHSRTIADYVAFCDDLNAAAHDLQRDLTKAFGLVGGSGSFIAWQAVMEHIQPVLRKHCRRADPEIECAS